MKRVAVSQRVDKFHQGQEIRDGLDQELSRFILACDALPLPIPNVLDEHIEAWLMSVSPDALVLSGGNDIGACKSRDACEAALLKWAVKHHVPVLGICRGMQYINHWFGGTLAPIQGHVRVRHQITGEINQTVNSYHNFSILDLAQEFHVVAVAKDKTIKAIRHNSLPMEGWMWHPEREITFSGIDIERFKAMLEKAQ